MTPFSDVRLFTRYGVAKSIRLAQRVTFQVGVGCLLVVGSAFWSQSEQADRMFRAGTFIVGASLGWWAKHQGQRRKDPSTGRELRHPTLRVTPEEAERIQKLLRK